MWARTKIFCLKTIGVNNALLLKTIIVLPPIFGKVSNLLCQSNIDTVC